MPARFYRGLKSYHDGHSIDGLDPFFDNENDLNFRERFFQDEVISIFYSLFSPIHGVILGGKIGIIKVRRESFFVGSGLSSNVIAS